ncbi:MAG: hypothetical protein WEB63_09065 [Cucumibacter sp.]
MNPSGVFYKFAECCADTSADYSQTPGQVIELALINGGVIENYAQLSRDFDELLSGKYSDEALDQLWMRTNARIKFKNYTRQFLELARQILRGTMAKAER